MIARGRDQQEEPERDHAEERPLDEGDLADRPGDLAQEPRVRLDRDGGDAIVGGTEPRRVRGDEPEGGDPDDGGERPAGRGTAEPKPRRRPGRALPSDHDGREFSMRRATKAAITGPEGPTRGAAQRWQAPCRWLYKKGHFMAHSGPIPFIDLKRLVAHFRSDVLADWAECLDNTEFVGGPARRRGREEARRPRSASRSSSRAPTAPTRCSSPSRRSA